MANYIFFDDRLLKRSGGPSTYLYNLKNGIEKIDKNKITFLYDESELIDKPKSKKREKAKKLALEVPFIYERYLMNKRKKKSPLYDKTSLVKENDIIMFHMTSDFSKAYNMLDEKCTKIVMSHSPEIAAKQMSAELSAQNKKYKFKYTYNKYLKEFDLPAFKNADIIVFPSKEAMDPYYETCENFDEIIKGKKLKFVETGTEKLEYKIEKNEFRKQHNIKDDAFVISFIGRHNLVKGYDSFVKICLEVLNKYEDVYVLTAGVGDIKSPEHERWIDIGWTNDPGSVANASDLFILPNKRTYFDLVLLEMLSIGKTCLASNTGGNKTVSKNTEGVILYNDINEAVEKIDYLYNNRDENNRLGKLNKDIYENRYTVEEFSKRYIKLFEEIEQEN